MHQEVRERLRSRIVDQTLKPGDHIDELNLAQEFGISRTPLREALKVLQSEGLITMVPRHGCFVAELSPRDLDDIYETVAVLEGRTARAVAETVTAKDLKRLQQLQERMESAAASAWSIARSMSCCRPSPQTAGSTTSSSIFGAC
jgi:DNA-binding GntR family transcriptional regulator